MKKIICLLLVIASLLFCLTSCGGKGEGEISVFYYTYSDTYISTVRSSIDKMLKTAGLDYNNYDANSNQTTQTEQIDTAIAKGSRLLIVNIVDTGSDDAAKTVIGKARAADIPVIFFNRSVSEEVVSSYDKCVFVGTDYEMAGHMQGELIGNYILKNYANYDLNGDGKISYVMFKGEQGNAEAEARTKFGALDANKILTDAGKAGLVFYDSKNTGKYLVDQGGNWSAQAANDYMKTILSAHSEKGGNMVELVIANNDEMALGAISALQEVGYNKSGGKTIPVFGIDATEGAVSKIKDGSMAGTIKQDALGMADVIVKVAQNMLSAKSHFDTIDKDNVVGNWRVNIPYAPYTQDAADNNEK
ncbi:MAG: galactose ABC transporter substrate-binding protein [Clostridia bacterium]|nr:galactose ABC transporter substrate-binding protein [Clostridia bacterium]